MWEGLFWNGEGMSEASLGEVLFPAANTILVPPYLARFIPV